MKRQNSRTTSNRCSSTGAHSPEPDPFGAAGGGGGGGGGGGAGGGGGRGGGGGGGGGGAGGWRMTFSYRVGSISEVVRGKMAGFRGGTGMPEGKGAVIIAGSSCDSSSR